MCFLGYTIYFKVNFKLLSWLYEKIFDDEYIWWLIHKYLVKIIKFKNIHIYKNKLWEKKSEYKWHT